MTESLKLAKGEAPPALSLRKEVGTTGLATTDGSVQEQIKKELCWPNVIDTYKNMYNDPMIYAGISLVKMMISKVQWEVVPPNQSPTEDQLQKTLFIKQCKDDMEHSWDSFIKEVLSFVQYGFAVHEKVFSLLIVCSVI